MKITKNIFAVIGVICTLMLCLVIAIAFYQANNAQEKVNTATEKDALFIINWARLDNSQNYRVLSSYQSKRYSILSDHLDYYCLQLEKFNPRIENTSQWKFGQEDNRLFNDARTSIASSGKAEQCFNTLISGTDQNIAAYIRSLKVYSRNIDSAQIIFYHKLTNRLLYVSLEN